jgi:rubredoxin
MSFEKRGKHTAKESVVAYRLGKHKCTACEAVFDVVSDDIHGCPDCKAGKESVVYIEDTDQTDK